ncbi:hypothetical protein QJS04_geneDACA017592 [Acorus gramineus]|uniref:Uncharacterized protein n=1 Tax=Acorus gramineus TaxID=55184 RepID=A0AAV9AXY8_ACOGR|nr:hypothetical protein QJS04_geneDACA017592 [Acorus gramineus]
MERSGRGGGVILPGEEAPYVALRDDEGELGLESDDDDYRLNRLGYKQELGRHLSLNGHN